MKISSLNIKIKLFFYTVTLFAGLLSCKKNNTDSVKQTPGQPIDLTKLTDSCSYTLDGISYICNQAYAAGKGNAGANLDTSTGAWKWDSDTFHYRVSYSIGTSPDFKSGNGGDLKIGFAKKFARNQLIRSVAPGILAPVSDTLLYYPTGEQAYAVDYNRFNSQNGVVLEIATGTVGNVKQTIGTYNPQPVQLPSTITRDSQKNAKFEITRIYWFPANGIWLNSHILEARFSANLFDRNEKLYRLENGYIRIHID